MSKFIEITVQGAAMFSTKKETISTDNILSVQDDGKHALITLKESVNGTNRTVTDISSSYQMFLMKAGML